MVKVALPVALLALGWAQTGLAREALVPCRAATLQRATSVGTDVVRQSTPANPAGCIFGASLTVDAATTLWRCVVDGGDAGEPLAEDGTEALVLLRAGKPAQVWPDTVMAGRYDAYQLLTVDLDADGAAERIVAVWNAQGNGLAVNHWTLRIFTSDWRLIDQYEDVQDWGPSSLFAAPPHREGCDVAITRFVEDDTGDEDVTMFEAQFLRLAAGRMTEAADRTPIRRRLTDGFARQRLLHFEQGANDIEGDVAAWLSTEPARR